MSDNFSLERDPVLFVPPMLENLSPTPPRNVFWGKKRNEKNFGGLDGLCQGASFTKPEVDRILELIHKHVIDHTFKLSPAAANIISSTSLDNYHLVSEKIYKEISTNTSHASLFSKLGRILPKYAIDEIKSMSFFDYVRDAFGSFILSDEENIGYEQICFRIVRPEQRDDVGALHRDSWFWEYYNFKIPDGKGRAKVWTQLCGEPREAGLLLCPGYHLVPGGFKAETIGGKLIFASQVDNKLPLRRFCGSHGDTIMFNYDNLHTGSLNRGKLSRASIEITILFNEEL